MRTAKPRHRYLHKKAHWNERGADSASGPRTRVAGILPPLNVAGAGGQPLDHSIQTYGPRALIKQTRKNAYRRYALEVWGGLL